MKVLQYSNNQDIAYYKVTIKEQEQQISNLNNQLESEKLKVQILITEKEELAVILNQEAKLARKALESELQETKTNLLSIESNFLQQIFNLETTNKQQIQKIVDLETGRSNLIKQIQMKEEMFKKQQTHYEQKLNDTKMYWQNKLSEKCQDLQNEIRDSTSQWEIKNKCIQNDFDIFRKFSQEQIDQLNLQLGAKDKDYDKLKDQYDKILQDLKIKENYFNTHKEENDKEVNNLQSQVTQLKELQINLEQRVNIQNYEINKQIIYFKDADSKIKKEQQKCSELQTHLNDLQISFDENLLILQNQNEEIQKLYKSAASYLKLDIQSHTPQQMLLFSQEYFQILIKQNQDLLLEKNELVNQKESLNLEWKQKCIKLTQMNASQEKRLYELDKKYADLQIMQLKNSLQKSVETPPPPKQEIRMHNFGMHKMEDLQIFLSNLEKSETVNKQLSISQKEEESVKEISSINEDDKNSQNLRTETDQKVESIIQQSEEEELVENQNTEKDSISIKKQESEIVEQKSSQKQINEQNHQLPMTEDPLPPPILIEQKTILLMGSAENDLDQSQSLGKSLTQNEVSEKIELIKEPSVTQEVIQKDVTESITLKEYFDQEMTNINQEKQDNPLRTLQQKNEIDFDFKKVRNKLRITKKTKQQKLKLITDNLNRTPETGYETTKVSRSTQIQTLQDTPYEIDEVHQQLNVKEVQTEKEEHLYKELGKLQFQLDEIEQDRLRMTLIIEYLQKMIPPQKITQEVSTQINNNDEFEKVIEELRDELQLLQSSSSKQSQELEETIGCKTKEIDDLKDLIANMSDQLYNFKFELKEKNEIIKDLNEKVDQLSNKQVECQVVVVEKQKESNDKLKSNTLNLRRDIKETEKDRTLTPNKFETQEDLKLKIYQLEKTVRQLNNKIAKKDQMLNSKQSQGEGILQLSQIQNMNVEVQDLRKQLESKQDQLNKCTTIIKYLEIELENYKSNYNIFNKPKLNTDRTVRYVQQPYQVSMSVQQKLPTLQEDMITTISKSSYKKRQQIIIIQKQLSLHQSFRKL